MITAKVRWGRFARTRAVWVGPLIAYLVLVLLGITNSNIGFDALREDPEAPLGLQIGASQGIRSDEWGTESPLWLGQLARAGAEDSTPLSVSNDFFAQLPSGPISAVVFFDGTALALGGWFPHEMLFAAKWWLPTLLLFIGVPIWFRQISGRLRWGYFAAFLIFIAPGSVWWSGRPVNTLGFIFAGCALAIYGAQRLSDRRWVRAALAIIVAGLLLARFPTYYQPLAIVIGIPVVLATAGFLLWRDVSWKQRLGGLAAIAASGLVWTLLLFWENREAVTAGLSTVYPGDRKSTGGALTAGMVFGATNLGWLEDLGTVLPLNQSEIATSFTVLLIIVVLLFATSRWRGGTLLAAALIPLVAAGLFWLSWGTLSWGSFGAAIPLVNRVPSNRAMLGVGYIAILAFCLYMSQWKPSKRVAVPLVAGGTAAFLSAYAGSSLQTAQIAGLTSAMIWASALITGGVIFVLIAWPLRWWSITIASVAAASLTFATAPIVVGLGDLRASASAEAFMEWGATSREDGTVWASNSQYVDSLMMATGTPTLSARQQIGPDVQQWERLDPGGAHREMWDRGGLHVTFEWTDESGVQFEQPANDTVVVKASPCTVAARMPEFQYAVSSEPLDDACLSELSTFTWSGIDYTVYRVDA
ncbi:hypothetical protein B1729_16170 [Microbacterium sp. B35-04]|nr:hypothetical protein B1729_16170 [Microbacterium sp. B35-04]